MAGVPHDADRPASVRMNYIKGNNFRVVHVDGAIGAITPRGLIHAALYSERLPIPRLMVHPIQDDGVLGPAIEREGLPGVVREIEISLMLDRATAESLREWLSERLADLDRYTARPAGNQDAQS